MGTTPPLCIGIVKMLFHESNKFLRVSFRPRDKLSFKSVLPMYCIAPTQDRTSQADLSAILTRSPKSKLKFSFLPISIRRSANLKGLTSGTGIITAVALNVLSVNSRYETCFQVQVSHVRQLSIFLIQVLGCANLLIS